MMILMPCKWSRHVIVMLSIVFRLVQFAPECGHARQAVSEPNTAFAGSDPPPVPLGSKDGATTLADNETTGSRRDTHCGVLAHAGRSLWSTVARVSWGPRERAMTEGAEGTPLALAAIAGMTRITAADGTTRVEGDRKST